MTSPVIIHQEEQLCTEGFEDESNGIVKWKTLFSSPVTQSDKLVAGLGVCPPNEGHLCKHRHLQPEIYYIVEGTGEVSIDGKTTNVLKGCAIYIPGNSEHGITNIGEGALKWFYVFPGDSFEEVKYVFS